MRIPQSRILFEMWGFHGDEDVYSNLKMEVIHNFETLVTTYKTIQHHNPEDHNWHEHYYFKCWCLIHCSYLVLQTIQHCVLTIHCDQHEQPPSIHSRLLYTKCKNKDIMPAHPSVCIFCLWNHSMDFKEFLY